MRSRVPFRAGVTAHALAWLGALFLAFWPWMYQGTEAIAVQTNIPSLATLERVEPSTLGVTGGSAPPEIRDFSASLIEVNGFRVLWVLAIPLTLSGAGLIGAMLGPRRRTQSIVYTWLAAVLLLAFCAAGAFSIGLLFLPAAIALIVAAGAGSWRPRAAIAS